MPAGMGERWVVAEVRYDSNEGEIRYGKPEVLSLKESEIRDTISLMLTAMLGAKGAFFAQVTQAILKDEKRRKKKEGK
jgi:hypothetical protein